MKIENSNLLDFFGIENEAFRTFYNESKKLTYLKDLVETSKPLTNEALPDAQTNIQPLTTYVVEKRQYSDQLLDISLIVLIFIAIVLIAYYAWIVYEDRKSATASKIKEASV